MAALRYAFGQKAEFNGSGRPKAAQPWPHDKSDENSSDEERSGSASPGDEGDYQRWQLWLPAKFLGPAADDGGLNQLPDPHGMDEAFFSMEHAVFPPM